MKTQIIQLEPHDDHISIRDKMNWSKTPRVLLIWPRRRRVDLDTLDLKLLQRHAIDLGSELGLVTKSNRVIRAAAELGIPTFANNLAAQREAWPLQKRSLHKRRLIAIIYAKQVQVLSNLRQNGEIILSSGWDFPPWQYSRF